MPKTISPTVPRRTMKRLCRLHVMRARTMRRHSIPEAKRKRAGKPLNRRPRKRFGCCTNQRGDEITVGSELLNIFSAQTILERLPVSTHAVEPPVAPSAHFQVVARRAVASQTEGDGPNRRCILSRPRQELVNSLVFRGGQWSGRGSNPQPPHCERGALPIELPPHLDHTI